MEMQIGSTVPTHATSKPDSEVMRYDTGTGKKRSRVSDDHECSTSEKGLITEEQYQKYDTKMRQKYAPIIGTLWAEMDLL